VANLSTLSNNFTTTFTNVDHYNTLVRLVHDVTPVEQVHCLREVLPTAAEERSENIRESAATDPGSGTPKTGGETKPGRGKGLPRLRTSLHICLPVNITPQATVMS